MKKEMVMVGTALMLAAGSAFGQARYDLNDKYPAHEFVIDAFGSAALGEQTIDHLSNARVRHNTRLGAGGGVGYFFTRNFGIDAEAYSENTRHSFVNDVLGDLIVRFPIGTSGLAPYVLGGGGRKFAPDHFWYMDGGAGLEFRFARKIGVFVDARFVVPERTKNYGLARLGMSFGF